MWFISNLPNPLSCKAFSRFPSKNKFHFLHTSLFRRFLNLWRNPDLFPTLTPKISHQKSKNVIFFLAEIPILRAFLSIIDLEGHRVTSNFGCILRFQTGVAFHCLIKMWFILMADYVLNRNYSLHISPNELDTKPVFTAFFGL